MPHLIEVETDLLNAMDALLAAEVSGAEAPQEALALFKERALHAAEKRDHLALAFSFLEERAASMREREKALAESRRALERTRERLEEFVLSVLVGKGIIVACGDTAKFVVAEVESVEVACPDALPDALCRIKTVREPDKTSIRLALDKGERIELAAGARIARRPHLRIRPLAVKDRPGDTLLKGRVE